MKKLTMIVMILISLLLGFINLYAQAPDTLWTKLIDYELWDVGYSAKQTYDGNFIIVGISEAPSAEYGYSDVLLIKLNEDGIIIWDTLINAYGMNYCWGRCIEETHDRGFIIVGTSLRASGGGYVHKDDFYLLKTDSVGNRLWEKHFGTKDGWENGYSVQQTNDMGYILVGRTSSYGAGSYDVWFIKTDSLGDTLWTKTYGGVKGDVGYSVKQTTDGGYIITGYTMSFGQGGVEDVWLIKTDSIGDSLWAKTFGGEKRDKGYSIQQTTDGGYIIAGLTKSFGSGGKDFYLIKTDSIGDTIWIKTYGGELAYSALSVEQTIDGGYIIAGCTKSLGVEEFDTWLIKTDSVGDTLWTGNYGKDYDDFANSAVQTNDEGYIIVGGGKRYEWDWYDVYIIRTEPESNFIEDEFIPEAFSISKAYPNPFIDIIQIVYNLPRISDVNITVYNVLGSRVKSLLNKRQNPGIYTINWDGRDERGNKLPSGFYFLRLEAGGYEGTRKLLLIR